MEWWFYIPTATWCLWVFILGLMVGSFLNVLIARLPYEKSIIWPGSTCFSCLKPIRLTDNIPVIGYLRLRGRCRYCHARFSPRYLLVELGTGLAFVGLFVLEILINPAGLPNVRLEPFTGPAFPPTPGLCLFAYHACLISLLIAAAFIDAEHRIIPTLIPYSGLLIGIVGGMLMPWPWPNANSVASLPPQTIWGYSETFRIPTGVQPWPPWGPLPLAIPAGSWQLGLITSLIGALGGSLVVRWIKWLFETGFGREALGLGDADLLMMAGAFLGWQIAVLSLFVGAFTAFGLWILTQIVSLFYRTRRVAGPQPSPNELPFGPGLALGVCVTWLGWGWLGPKVQFLFFEEILLGIVFLLISVGMLSAGLLLRRPEPESAK